MKEKLTEQERYDQIKSKIKHIEKMYNRYINEIAVSKNQLEEKIKDYKYSDKANQSKEFKAKVQLEQLKIREKEIIVQYSQKFKKYDKEINALQKKLNIIEPISTVKLATDTIVTKDKKEISLEIKHYIRRTRIKGYIFLILSGFICTIAFDYFISPSKVLPPGIGAFGKIFAQWIFPPLNTDNINNANLMYYVFFIIDNIPLLIFGWYRVGKNFAINTIIFMVCQTAFHIIINGVGSYHGIPYINSSEFHFLQNLNNIKDSSVHDLWIFFFGFIAAVLNGIGFGFTYIGDACPGGTDIVNNYISRTKKKPVGNVSIIVNTLVMLIVWAMSYTVKTTTPNPDFATYYFSAPFFAAIMVIVICGIVSNKVFPKYKNTTLLITTEKPEAIIAKLKEQGIKNNIIWKIEQNIDEAYKEHVYMVVTTISVIIYKRISQAILLADPEALIRAQSTYKAAQMPRSGF